MKLSLLFVALLGLAACSHEQVANNPPHANGLTVVPVPPPNQPEAPDIGGPGIPPPLVPDTPPPPAE